MNIRFSPGTLGFYPFDMNYSNLPSDLIEISSEEYAAAMSGQNDGLEIYAGAGGRPSLRQRASPPMTEAVAIADRTNLIAAATNRIAPLQDMIDLGDATPAEEAALLDWKRYRIALTRITDVTPGWPASIVWPVMPS